MGVDPVSLIVGGIVAPAVGAAAQTAFAGGGGTVTTTAKEPAMVSAMRSRVIRAATPILLDLLEHPEHVGYYTGLQYLVPPLTPAEQTIYNMVQNLYTQGTPYDILLGELSKAALEAKPEEYAAPAERAITMEAFFGPSGLGAIRRGLEALTGGIESELAPIIQQIGRTREAAGTLAQLLEQTGARTEEVIGEQAETMRRQAEDTLRNAVLGTIQQYLAPRGSLWERLAAKGMGEAAGKLSDLLERELANLRIPEVNVEAILPRLGSEEIKTLASAIMSEKAPKGEVGSVLPFLAWQAPLLRRMTTARSLADYYKDLFAARQFLDKMQLGAAKTLENLFGLRGMTKRLAQFAPWAAIPREREYKRKTAPERLWEKIAETAMGMMRIQPAGSTTTTKGPSFGQQFLSHFLPGVGSYFTRTLLNQLTPTSTSLMAPGQWSTGWGQFSQWGYEGPPSYTSSTPGGYFG